MNIFQFLVHREDHRKDNKVTQLVKHYDEVSDKHKGKELVGQVKADGVCALTVVLDGKIKIFSRTGKQFTNTYYMIEAIYKLKLADGVYMGEMCCSYVSLEVLSGIVNPNRVKPVPSENEEIPKSLEMYFFDNISIKEFLGGRSFLTYSARHAELDLKLNLSTSSYKGIYIKVLPIYNLIDEEAIDRLTSKLVKDGEEGIVLRDPDAGWEAGHKGWRVMKKVRGVDYDLRCIGFEEGTGKYAGKVANLIFQWKNGLTIKAMLGKGWTHQMAKDMYWDVSTPNTPIGKIFQVYALEESSKGKLRLPKVGEVRFDKDHSDV